MRNILVFQHVPHEILGTLNPLLKKHGFRIRYVNFGRDPNAEPSLDGYNGLIVLGGPMGVYEAKSFPHLKVELRIIEQAVKKGIPILGICLGAQLVAHVLKADVRRHTTREIGWHPVHLTDQGHKDPLFKLFEKSESVFQMHGDTFDIPRTAEHLAFSELCEGQAFRYGERIYGLQFHLEVDEDMILRWLKIHAKDVKACAPLTETDIVNDTQKFIQRSLALSQDAFSNFIKIFNLPEKRIGLGTDHGKPRK